MKDSSTLEELRAKAAQIMRENPAPASVPEDRQIILFEDELREANVLINAAISFSELDPTLHDHLFNSQHGFTGALYLLSWEPIKAGASAWALMVQNQKSSGKRRLLDCPLEMKQVIVPMLSTFAMKIAAQFKPEIE